MQRSGRPLLAIEGQQDGTVAVHVDWLGTLDQRDVAQPGAPCFGPPAAMMQATSSCMLQPPSPYPERVLAPLNYLPK